MAIPPPQPGIAFQRTRSPLRAAGLNPARHRWALPIKPLVLRLFYCFVFSIPFESLDTSFTISGSLSLSKVVGYAFIVSSVFQPRLLFRRPPRAFYYFVTYLVILIISSTQHDSQYFPGVVSEIGMLAQMFVLFWLSYNLMRFPRVRRGVVTVFAASCLLLALLQLTGVTAADVRYGSYQRVSALGENLNTAGAVLALGLISLLGMALGDPVRRLRILAWPLCLIIAAPMVQTGSRGALVGFALGAITVILQHGGLTAKLKGITTACIILGVIGVLTLQSGVARMRWEETLYTQHKMAGREDIYPAAMDMVAAQPIMGWGPVRNIYELGRRLGEVTRDTHNGYLWFLTEVGLVGSLPVFAAFLLCLRQAWRARKGIDGVLPLALLVTVLTVNMAGTYHNRKWFWLVLSLSMASGIEMVVRPPRPSGIGLPCGAPFPPRGHIRRPKAV